MANPEFCKNICPLVADGANRIQPISTGILRKKYIVLENGIVAYTSVLVEPQFPETGKEGIKILKNEVACRDMQRFLRFVRGKKRGGIGGTLNCRFTNNTKYGGAGVPDQIEP